MKMRPVSYSVSRTEKSPQTNFENPFMLGASTITFIEILATHLAECTLVARKDRSNLVLAKWELILRLMKIRLLLVYFWSVHFECDDLFSNEKYTSENGDELLITRTSQNPALENRQHWLISGTSMVTGLSVSMDILWLWLEIIVYARMNPGFMKKENMTDTQAYIATLWLQAILTICLTVILFKIWGPVMRLVSLRSSTWKEKRTRQPMVHSRELEDSTAVLIEGYSLMKQEHTIERFWETIYLLLESIKFRTRNTFAEYRKEAEEGKLKLDYDPMTGRRRAQKATAMAVWRMNEILDMWADIKSELTSFEG